MIKKWLLVYTILYSMICAFYYPKIEIEIAIRRGRDWTKKARVKLESSFKSLNFIYEIGFSFLHFIKASR